MKLIKRDKDDLYFHLGRREKGLLLHLFKLYPVLPAKYSKPGKATSPKAESQELLEEALEQHRAEQKEIISGLLQGESRWSEHHHGWKLRLKASEVESLLQALNDVRIGSWVKLGSPENPMQVINEQTAPDLWAMEIAGSFEMDVLHTLQTPPPGNREPQSS